jgi:SGNH domain (fused to AT3 domains)
MSTLRLLLMALVVAACQATFAPTGPIPALARPAADAAPAAGTAQTAGTGQTVEPAQTVAPGQVRPGASPTLPAGGPSATLVATVNPPNSPMPSPQESAQPNLPPTKDGPVPADLRPSLLAAPEDYPPTFADGCNVPEGGTASRGTCLYGVLSSKVTIALFGDSHAAFWFPAVEAFAVRQGWRLLNLTMSSCTPADLSVYNSIFKRIYRECPAWRKQAVARLVKTRPAVILVTGTHGISPVDSSGDALTGDALTQAWETGMTRTIETLRPAAGLVILMADTPVSGVNPPVCLAAHRTSILACATPLEKALDPTWLAVEEQVVAQTGVGFIDPTDWVCPSNPCPPVLGNLVVYQNAGHLTAGFAAALANVLGDAIQEQLAAHGLIVPATP